MRIAKEPPYRSGGSSRGSRRSTRMVGRGTDRQKAMGREAEDEDGQDPVTMVAEADECPGAGTWRHHFLRPFAEESGHAQQIAGSGGLWKEAWAEKRGLGDKDSKQLHPEKVSRAGIFRGTCPGTRVG